MNVPVYLKVAGLAVLIVAIFVLCLSIISAAIAGHWGSHRAVSVYRASRGGGGVDDWNPHRRAGFDSDSRTDRGRNRGDRACSRERVFGLWANVRRSFEPGESGGAASPAKPRAVHERAGSLRVDASRGAQQFRSDLDGSRAGVLESATWRGRASVYRRSTTRRVSLPNIGGRLAERNVRLAGGGWIWLNLLELVRRVSRSDRERSDCRSGSGAGRRGSLVADGRGNDRRNSGCRSFDWSGRATAPGDVPMRLACS